MGCAGVEPDVQDILLLFKGLATALGAGKSFREEVVGGVEVPGVGAFLREHPGNRLDRLVVHDRLAAVLAVEDGDWHAPPTLAGDAPVVPVADHRGDPVAAPLGDPLDVVDRLDRVLLDRINRAEPLFGRPEHDRLFAAPAVGVLVGDLFGREDGPAGF